MQLTLHDPQDSYTISSFTGEGIVIEETLYTSSLIVTPGRIFPAWPVHDARHLARDDLDELLRHEPELVVLGTGATQVFPDLELVRALMHDGLGIEVMDTASACRTYNILASENRRVGAALIL